MWNWIKWNIWRNIQKLFRGYGYDVQWEFYFNASRILLPMFEKFRLSEKHGFPSKLICDFKEDLVSLYGEEKVQYFIEGEEYEYDNDIVRELEDIWYGILMKIYKSLQYVSSGEDYLSYLYDRNPNYDSTKSAITFKNTSTDEVSEIILNSPLKLNKDRLRYFEEEISEGFELMGRYWRCLWD